MQIIETKLPTNGSFSRRSRTDEIILHHAEAKSASVEEVNRWHLERGWTGIGYHFYIRKDGKVYRGRPEWAVGAHAQGHNSRAIGICCEGAYMTETMPKAQLDALKALIREEMHKYPNAKLLRHKDVNETDCPGRNFPWAEAQKYSEVKKEEPDMTEAQTRAIAKQEIAKAKDKVYNSVAECPAWAKDTVQKLVNKGFLQGGAGGKLALTEDLLRVLVINDRAKLYG